MNSDYMKFWQSTFTDAFDNKKHFEVMDRLLEQAFSGIEGFTSMMTKPEQWSMFTHSIGLMNPLFSGTFDFKKSYNDYLQMLGLVSIDEYRSLIKKYEELKKQSDKHEKAEAVDKSKIADLNKKVSDQKKKTSTREKSLETQKNKLAEQKKLYKDLEKQLSSEKKLSESLKKELSDIKKQADTLKKELAVKENKS